MDSFVHFLLFSLFYPFLTFFLCHLDYEGFTNEGGQKVVLQERYKGLLLSSCQSVPMFSGCNNMKKAVKQTPRSGLTDRQIFSNTPSIRFIILFIIAFGLNVASVEIRSEAKQNVEFAKNLPSQCIGLQNRWLFVNITIVLIQSGFLPPRQPNQ